MKGVIPVSWFENNGWVGRHFFIGSVRNHFSVYPPSLLQTGHIQTLSSVSVLQDDIAAICSEQKSYAEKNLNI